MRFKFIITVLLCLSHISLGFIGTQICQHFVINKINKCKLKTWKEASLNEQRQVCVCKDMNVKLNFTNSTLTTISKIDGYTKFEIYLQNQKPVIFDNKFKIFDPEFFKIPITGILFLFIYLKGFDVNFFENKSKRINYAPNIYIYDSYLAFYSNERHLKTCIGFPLKPRTLFQVFKSSTIKFYSNKFKPICPLAFANSRIYVFLFLRLVNTFYKTSIPTFLDLPENITQISTEITSIAYIGLGGVYLNRRIISPHVFNLTKRFHFSLKLSGIEKGLFKSFRQTKSISINRKYWRNLFHKGIEWIYDLNSHVRVDLNNSAEIREYFENDTYLNIHCLKTAEGRTDKLKEIDIFPDKDFCIYAKFPFEQMIFVIFDELHDNFTYKSCTFIWLVHPKQFLNETLNSRHNRFSKFKVNLEKYFQLFDDCDFYQR